MSDFQDPKAHLFALVQTALTSVAPDLTDLTFVIERPKQAAHGDYACNVAMQLTRSLRRNPRELAQAIGLHVTQLRRYEAGTSQPTLDVLRRLAVVLSVSADLLLFDRDERGPGDDLRLEFEAVSRLDAKDKEVVRSVLEGILLKHEARRVLGQAAQGGV